MRRKGSIKKKVALLLGGIYVACAAMMPVCYVNAAEAADATSTIVVDGKMNDWVATDSLAVSDGSVKEWRLAKSADGSTVYLCFNGVASTEWDSTYMWDFVEVTNPDGTTFRCQINNLASAWIMPGAEVATSSNASGTNAGDYVVECVLPLPADAASVSESESGYSITFAGTTIAVADIPEFIPAQEYEAVYEGIVIDGKYGDWAAVACVDAKCPNTEHGYDCLSGVACVFDGEYVYIYLKDGATGDASGAGINSNGRYSITTDLGRQLVFQVTKANGGSVSGVEGATVAYYGDEWEIAIPASELPMWKEGISFGSYQSEPYITGIVNIRGENASGPAGEFSGIVYDGLYGDWDAYPHKLIHYATSGTQTDAPDGEGALYLDDTTLYGHVESTMKAHLDQKGSEFDSAISICFNGDRDYNADMTWNFYPRLVAVAADGTIDWNPETETLEEGTYEFYLADARGEYNTSRLTNVSDLAEHEKFFGKMMITVGETKDEIEFMVDLEQVATFLSHYSDTTVLASDFQLIEAQFGEIGQDYLAIAGASAGPFAGIVIALAATGGVLYKRRRSKVVK